MIIELSKCKVEVKDHLTWGDKEQVKSVFVGSAQIGDNELKGFNGLAIFQAKLKLMERVILKITEGDKVIPFSNEWAENLPVEDGDKLYSAIDELDKKKL